MTKYAALATNMTVRVLAPQVPRSHVPHAPKQPPSQPILAPAPLLPTAVRPTFPHPTPHAPRSTCSVARHANLTGL